MIMEKKVRQKEDYDHNDETMMRDVLKKEMLRKIEERIADNDINLIRNLKQMLTDKENNKK